jgi:hypothetical protein
MYMHKHGLGFGLGFRVQDSWFRVEMYMHKHGLEARKRLLVDNEVGRLQGRAKVFVQGIHSAFFTE